MIGAAMTCLTTGAAAIWMAGAAIVYEIAGAAMAWVKPQPNNKDILIFGIWKLNFNYFEFELQVGFNNKKYPLFIHKETKFFFIYLRTKKIIKIAFLKSSFLKTFFCFFYLNCLNIFSKIKKNILLK